jgi:hypothetical protein
MFVVKCEIGNVVNYVYNKLCEIYYSMGVHLYTLVLCLSDLRFSSDSLKQPYSCNLSKIYVILKLIVADQSGPFKRWDLGFESHLHESLCAFILCLCLPACS